MSTILKALRRLEEERRSSGERPLREEVAAPGPIAAEPRRRSWVPWLVAAAGVLGLAGVLFSQWPLGVDAPPQVAQQAPPTDRGDVAARSSPAASAAAPAPARAAIREPVPPVAVRPPTQPPESARALPEDAFASDVEVVARPPAQPRSPLALGRASEPLPEPGAQPGDAAQRSAELEPERAAPTVAQAPPAPDPTPAPRAKPAPAPQLEPAPAPAPRTEPARARPEPERTEPVRQTVARAEPAPTTPAPEAPELRVERTLWHPSASRRAAFVALDGEAAVRVAEGDVLGRYVVSEIRPSGVVFLQDGKPLERKVGAGE